MVVRRVGVLSLAKVSGVLYALIGLIFGGLISLFSIVGSSLGGSAAKDAFGGIMFGAAAVIIIPICYGLLGFIGSLIAGALYNVIAGMVGGIELELQ
jgi:hypothetical protein